MAETTFAKSYLKMLESRPVKVPADHVADPKTYPARTPYILPRMSKPMNKPTTVLPGQERSLTVLLKSLRNPPLDLKLTSQPRTTSMLEVKTAVSERAHIPAEKIKLLHRKKPVADSKSLGDLLEDGQTGAAEVELSVMVIGGAAASVQTAEGSSRPATGSSVAAGMAGAEVLKTAEFWNDLKGFLQQRLKDEKEANELSELFRAAVESKG